MEVLALLFLLHRENGDFSILMKDILLVRMVASVHNAAQFFLHFLIWGLLCFQFADVLVDLKSLNLVVGSPLCCIEVESLT